MAIQQFGLLEPTHKHSIVLVSKLGDEASGIDAWWAAGKRVYLVRLLSGTERTTRFVVGVGSIADLAPFGGTYYLLVTKPLSVDTLLDALDDIQPGASL